MAPGRVKTQTCLLHTSGHPGRSREAPTTSLSPPLEPISVHLKASCSSRRHPDRPPAFSPHLPPDTVSSSDRPAVFPGSRHGPLGSYLPPRILQSGTLGLTVHGHLPGPPAPHAQIAPLPLRNALPQGLAGTAARRRFLRSACCPETI